MKRGDVITVALHGDLGKPRPAVVLESDRLAATDHVLVCPGTSFLVKNGEPRRVLVMPDAHNGLRVPTQFQADKVNPARRDRCREVIGRLDEATMELISSRLIAILGLAD